MTHPAEAMEREVSRGKLQACRQSHKLAASRPVSSPSDVALGCSDGTLGQLPDSHIASYSNYLLDLSAEQAGQQPRHSLKPHFISKDRGPLREPLWGLGFSCACSTNDIFLFYMQILHLWDGPTFITYMLHVLVVTIINRYQNTEDCDYEYCTF